MVRHGLALKRRHSAGTRYWLTRWPRFTPHAHAALMRWFSEHGRQFPWRDPQVPTFQRLVAEMLLRQTSAGHVQKVWPELVRRYPSAEALAAAAPEQLQAVIEPLGMQRQRTAALQAAARHLLAYHGGQVPLSQTELAAIPHVGPYTANAVRCFGLGTPVPVVDVNILRVFARYLGVQVRAVNPHRDQRVWTLADRVLPETGVAEFQYALLDLGALVCRAKHQLCHLCPVSSGCQTAKHAKRPASP